MKKKNILVIGASGGVATAFLRHFDKFGSPLGKLVLVDRVVNPLTKVFAKENKIDYIFIQKEINLPAEEKEYLALLKKYSIDIVLDVTDSDTFPIFDATEKAGVSYVNTGMNCELQSLTQSTYILSTMRKEYKRAPHILFSGMNPGIVNMWVQYGIEKFGLPKDIVHFEYDTSTARKKWLPTVSWSIHEFLMESVIDFGGLMLGRNNVKVILPCSLKNRVDMTDILSPIMKLDQYPRGSQTLHEENFTIAQKYNIPSRFIYAINQRTMEYLEKTYDEDCDIAQDKIFHGNNVSIPINGSDNIGVCLEYPRKKVYYFNTMANEDFVGTSATYTQVIFGVYSALYTLTFDTLQNGVHFVEDLYHTTYPQFLFENMKVEEYIFAKKSNKLVLEKHTPQVSVNSKKKKIAKQIVKSNKSHFLPHI